MNGAIPTPDEFNARDTCGSGWVSHPWLEPLFVVSDSIIAWSYYAISVALVAFLVLHPPASKKILRGGYLFSLFILLCGWGHDIDAGMFDVPNYGLLAINRAANAVVSAATLVFVVSKWRSLAVRAADLSRDRLLFDTAYNDPTGVPVAKVAQDGRFLWVNEALCRFLRMSREELLGRSFYEVTPRRFIEIDAPLWRECIDRKRDRYSIDKMYCCGDGTDRWATLSVTVVRDKSGEVDHSISQIIPKHEEIMALEAARSARELLEDRVQDLEAAISGKANAVTELLDRWREEGVYRQEAADVG